MPIDTASKRRSVAGLPFWVFGPGVTPDATPGAEWRQQAGWGYSGITAASPPESLNVVFVGDSIHELGGGYDSRAVPEIAGHLLEKMAAIRTVNVNNQAHSGSATADWQAGGAHANAAVTAIGGMAGTVYVPVTLGANDSSASVAAATYGANLDNIIDWITDEGAVPILNYPPWRAAPLDTFLLAYQAQIDARVGTTVNGITVLRGDVLAYDWFAANHAAETSDGVHPNEEGSESLAAMDAWAIWNAVVNVYPAESQVASGVDYGPTGDDFTGSGSVGGGSGVAGLVNGGLISTRG